MNKRSIINLSIAGGLFLLFIVFTVIVKFVDVKIAGETLKEVGLATLNSSVFNALGKSSIWDLISVLSGYVILLVPVIFATIALIQLIKRKNIKLIDKEYLILAGLYVVMAGFYVLFEVMVINYRPILVLGEVEASYPSSHTLLACVILGSALVLVLREIKKKPLKISLISAIGVLFVIGVIGRLLSGMHWLTDIIAGLILGSALVMLYYACVNIKKKECECEEVCDTVEETKDTSAM